MPTTPFARRQLEELRAQEGITVYEAKADYSGGLQVRARCDGFWLVTSIKAHPITGRGWDER
jgi:hypothetical protein